MIYSESQLNAMNKSNLVLVTLELGRQLESAQSGPLKSSDVEKKMLDLARQATSVKDNAIRREQEHKENLAQIEADLKLAKAKLELEFKIEEGVEAKALTEMYKDLEEKAKAAAEDLTFGLKKAEIETQTKIEELQTKLEEAKDKYQEELDAWKLKVTETQTKASQEIADINLAHAREIEATQYKNSIALRDSNITALNELATKVGKTAVDNSELTSLKEFKAEAEADVTGKIETAVKEAKSAVYAQEGAKYGALKSSSDNEISLLKKDKEYLTAQSAEKDTRIAALEAQIAAFPGQLKDAVAAAKADITVQQDNKK